MAYTRNKLIAEAFYLTGDIEKYGTGYTRIRKEIADYPTMKFEFEEKPSAWLVTISYEKRKTEEISNIDNAGTLELATDQVKTLIISLKEKVLSVDELQLATELATKVATSSRQNFRKTYLLPAIKEGFVAMLYPDRPHHPKQKYYLTDKGKELLKTLEAQS